MFNEDHIVYISVVK